MVLLIPLEHEPVKVIRHHIGAPERLRRQRVGLAVLRLRLVRQCALGNARRQLHEVVGDEAHHLGVVPVKGISDDKGVFRRYRCAEGC